MTRQIFAQKLAVSMLAGEGIAAVWDLHVEAAEAHQRERSSVAAMLIEMRQDEGFPVALGVIYEDPRPTFESAVVEQNKAAASGKQPDLQKLVARGQTWQVEKEPHKL